MAAVYNGISLFMLALNFNAAVIYQHKMNLQDIIFLMMYIFI